MLPLPPTAPFTPEQIGWLNGYLAARMQAEASPSQPAEASPAPNTPGQKVTLIWGSQTGTSESLAKKAAKSLTSAGHEVTVQDMASVESKSLSSAEHLLVITSTYGDGEPPDNAADLHEALHGDDAPDLSAVSFSVLGLGDSEYPDFNQCAKEFDSVFEKLGAKRLSALIECDVDYDDPFDQWLMSTTDSLAAS
jgi:sulfite reductase (NADPH) flavoprotein alpha-component